MRITPVQADVNVGADYPHRGIPAQAFQSGYAQAGIEIARGAEDIGRIVQQKQRQDADAEGIFLQSQAELALQRDDADRKKVATDGPQYYEERRKAINDVIQQVGATAKTPGGRRVFETHMARSVVTLHGHAVNYAAELSKKSEVAQMTTTLGNFDEQIATLDPNLPDYEQRVIDINAKKDAAIMLRAPTIGLDDATRLVQANRKTTLAFVQKRGRDLEEADARRRFEDPGVRPQVIKDLYLGNVYKFLPQDKQIELKDQLVKAENERVDKIRVLNEREKKERADKGQIDIVTLTRAGQFAEANRLLEHYGPDMGGDKKKEYGQFITSESKVKRVADPATHIALSPEVYEANTVAQIEVARRKVIRAAGAQLIDEAIQDKFLSHLQAMEKSLTTKGKDEAMTAYHAERADVQARLKEDLRVTGPLASLVGGAQQTYALALNDLSRVAPAAAPGEERPEAWFNRTKAGWIGRVGAAANSRVLELERGASASVIEQEIAVNGGKPSLKTLEKMRNRRDAENIRLEYQSLMGKPMTVKEPDEESSTSTTTGATSKPVVQPAPQVDPRAAAPRMLQQQPTGGKKYGME